MMRDARWVGLFPCVVFAALASAATLALLLDGCGKNAPGTAAGPCDWHVGASTDTGPCVLPADSADAGLARLQTPLVKLGQLVGDQDLQFSPPTPTVNLTVSRVGLTGTDRGTSFMHDGQLYFFFGDTNPTLEACSDVRPFAADAIAVLDLALPDGGIDPMSQDGGLPLRFLTAADGNWLPVTLDGAPLLVNKLPLAGFSSGADVYAFFASPGHDSAVLGVAHDDGTAASLAAYTSVDAGAGVRGITKKMLNVFPLQIPTAGVPGLGAPWSGDTMLVWGRPARDSADATAGDLGDPIYLAAAPFADVGNTSAWMFYAGGAPGSPTWLAGDENARPIDDADVAARCNGGFSITYLPGLDRWLLLERCDGPHQIRFRVAPTLVGPWSEERIFFDPVTDDGFAHFMHVPGCDQDFSTMLADPTGAAYWGASGTSSLSYPYAPFVVGPSVQYDAASGTVSFLLLVSVWNPYSPMVMRAQLTGVDVAP